MARGKVYKSGCSQLEVIIFGTPPNMKQLVMVLACVVVTASGLALSSTQQPNTAFFHVKNRLDISTPSFLIRTFTSTVTTTVSTFDVNYFPCVTLIDYSDVLRQRSLTSSFLQRTILSPSVQPTASVPIIPPGNTVSGNTQVSPNIVDVAVDSKTPILDSSISATLHIGQDLAVDTLAMNTLQPSAIHSPAVGITPSMVHIAAPPAPSPAAPSADLLFTSLPPAVLPSALSPAAILHAPLSSTPPASLLPAAPSPAPFSSAPLSAANLTLAPLSPATFISAPHLPTALPPAALSLAALPSPAPPAPEATKDVTQDGDFIFPASAVTLETEGEQHVPRHSSEEGVQARIRTTITTTSTSFVTTSVVTINDPTQTIYYYCTLPNLDPPMDICS